MSPEKRNLAVAISSWGRAMPRWIQVLAEACDASSQKRVADLLGISSAYVSRLLSNTYGADTAKAEQLVLANFTSDRVPCPFWRSSIPLSSCQRARRRQAPQGEIFMSLKRACERCPHNTDLFSKED